jgi:hypothetical protein
MPPANRSSGAGTCSSAERRSATVRRQACPIFGTTWLPRVIMTVSPRSIASTPRWVTSLCRTVISSPDNASGGRPARRRDRHDHPADGHRSRFQPLDGSQSFLSRPLSVESTGRLYRRHDMGGVGALLATWLGLHLYPALDRPADGARRSAGRERQAAQAGQMAWMTKTVRTGPAPHTPLQWT